jgi:thiamine biosynthesis lipoprotein
MVLRRHGSSTRPSAALACLAALAVIGAACRGALGPGSDAAPRPAEVEAAPLFRVYEHRAMGTLFTLSLWAPDLDLADRAAAAAFQRVDRVEAVATDYAATSEARRLPVTSSGEWVEVSAELGRVLSATAGLVPLAQGAFDPTVGVLTHHWRRALRQGQWPDQAAWDQAAARLGWSALVQVDGDVTRGTQRCRVLDPQLRLDFGGVAKGVAVDEALAEVEAHGIRSALMDGGGDLRALDPPPGSAGWRVEVLPFGQKSQRRLRFLLARAAIATSGDVYRSGALEGEPLAGLSGPGAERSAMHYGHVIDPRSALPLPSPRASVMTAATAAEADALATARLVIGPLRTGVTALERGLFFAGEDQEPCVGERFPHDGAVPVPTVTPKADLPGSTESLQRQRDA